MRRTKYFALCLTVYGGMGCTQIKVRKFTGTEPGIRYSLPSPFLLVTPKTDGGIDVKVVYLPDPQNTYAIKADSFLSAHTLNVSLENGLLKKVAYKPDATAVAAQLTESMGNFAQANIDARAEAEKARSERVAKGRDGVETAMVELNALRAEKEALEDNLKDLKDKNAPADERSAVEKDIRATEVKIAIAEAKLASAMAALRSLSFSAFSVPGGTDLPKAWGPMLFRIMEDANSDAVILKVVEDQPELMTSTPPSLELPKHAIPEFRIQGSRRVEPDQNQRLQFRIVSNVVLRGIKDRDAMRLWNRDNNQDVAVKHRPALTLQPGGKEIIVDLADDTPRGSYRLSFVFAIDVGGQKQNSRGDVVFEVKR